MTCAKVGWSICGSLRCTSTTTEYSNTYRTWQSPTKKAREILLLAVEIFDDALVGSTNRSFERGTEADLIFKRWA
jgi:hypothetical protein